MKKKKMGDMEVTDGTCLHSSKCKPMPGMPCRAVQGGIVYYTARSVRQEARDEVVAARSQGDSPVSNDTTRKMSQPVRREAREWCLLSGEEGRNKNSKALEVESRQCIARRKISRSKAWEPQVGRAGGRRRLGETRRGAVESGCETLRDGQDQVIYDKQRLRSRWGSAGCTATCDPLPVDTAPSWCRLALSLAPLVFIKTDVFVCNGHQENPKFYHRHMGNYYQTTQLSSAEHTLPTKYIWTWSGASKSPKTNA
ncbi:hypothetical protein B0H14DRAFT_2654280 [Mycena olivaceomarginata]|nr:hypothetical protein B0H14DRAFT_2654280 [Mycena olivaceomarginata]